MTLSTRTKRQLAVGIANQAAATELIAAIDAQGSGPAAVVTAFVSTTDLPVSACAGTTTPSATNVNAAIDTVTAATEARLDAIESKINSILTALKNASLMATS